MWKSYDARKREVLSELLAVAGKFGKAHQDWLGAKDKHRRAGGLTRYKEFGK